VTMDDVTMDDVTMDDVAMDVTEDIIPDEGAVAAPTWDGEVQAILAASCAPCHTTQTKGAWSTADHNSIQADSYHCSGLSKGACIVERILEDSMPTNGSVLSMMTESGELDILIAWVESGME